MNKRNQNKNKTKSRHIQINHAFYYSIYPTNIVMLSLKDGFTSWLKSQKEDFLSIIYYNVCLSIISGPGVNPIFFNKKNTDWTSRTLANPPPPTPNNTSFLSYAPSPLKVEVTCVSPLNLIFYLSYAIFSLSCEFEFFTSNIWCLLIAWKFKAYFFDK